MEQKDREEEECGGVMQKGRKMMISRAKPAEKLGERVKKVEKDAASRRASLPLTPKKY